MNPTKADSQINDPLILYISSRLVVYKYTLSSLNLSEVQISVYLYIFFILQYEGCGGPKLLAYFISP